MGTLGEVLRGGRDSSGFTLRQVEESTGISNAYLSQLENDKIKKPSANVLYKLAVLYGIKLEELFRAAAIITADPNEKLVFNASIGPFVIASDEEQALIDYLGYLRFKKKHNR